MSTATRLQELSKHFGPLFPVDRRLDSNLSYVSSFETLLEGGTKGPDILGIVIGNDEGSMEPLLLATCLACLSFNAERLEVAEEEVLASCKTLFTQEGKQFELEGRMVNFSELIAHPAWAAAIRVTKRRVHTLFDEFQTEEVKLWGSGHGACSWNHFRGYVAAGLGPQF